MSKETLLPLLAGHVLAHGLGGASLRPLAKAAGTSDRMLIYHFGTKGQLLGDLVSYIASIYSAQLDAIMPAERATDRHRVLARIMAQNGEPATRPFLMLWWEIVAGSSRGIPGFREAAQRMIGELLAWFEGQMPLDDPDPAGAARFLLTVIEGTLMLEAVGHETTAREGLLAGGLLPS